MVTRIGSTTGTTMRGPTQADGDFALSIYLQNKVVSFGGDESDLATGDANFKVYSTSVTDRLRHVLVSDKTTNEPLTFESLNEDIITIDDFGKVARITDGTATILVKSRLLNKKINTRVNRSFGVSATVFVNYLDGSLAKHCCEAIDSRLLGKAVNTTQSVYSLQDHGSAIYVRNPNFWLSDIDLTCCSPWNDDQANKRAGTLVSPRHIVFATHYQLSIGGHLRFVTNDNEVITRTMTNSASAGSDLYVGVLDSDVPNTIGFAKVLPSNAADYLPNLDKALSEIYLNTAAVAAIGLDFEEKALVLDLIGFANDSHAAVSDKPKDTKRLEFYEGLIPGDSGNPEFLLINNELVIITTWSSDASGPSIHQLASGVNSAMTSLGGGYQLTEVDLSDFNTY